MGVTSPIGKKRQKSTKASSNSAKRREDKGKPKFGCSLAWAQDTSPIVAPSPNTPGPKGKVMLGSANCSFISNSFLQAINTILAFIFL